MKGSDTERAVNRESVHGSKLGARLWHHNGEQTFDRPVQDAGGRSEHSLTGQGKVIGCAP